MRKPDCISRQRRGFTLVEMLVVIGVLLIILVMTAAAVSFGFEAEKVSSAGQQARSMLEGARDRAIYSKEPRGVRFFSDDPAEPHNITGMAFIAPNETWTDGTIQLERATPGDPVATIVGGSLATSWWQLKKRGLIMDGLRVRIPNDRTGSWYTISTAQIDTSGTAPPNSSFDPANQFPYKLQITPPYRDPADNPANERRAFKDGPITYALELPPRYLPEQASRLPDGTVLDLRSSSVPESWRVLHGATSADGIPRRLAYMDIMFSPRGTVTGSAASQGIIHLYFTDIKSHDLFEAKLDELGLLGGPFPLVPPLTLDVDGTTEAVGDRSLLTIFTRTGALAANEIDPTDIFDPGDLDTDMNTDEPDSIADDPFRFAETSLGAK